MWELRTHNVLCFNWMEFIAQGRGGKDSECASEVGGRND
jgi:hypothetical protein